MDQHLLLFVQTKKSNLKLLTLTWEGWIDNGDEEKGDLSQASLVLFTSTKINVLFID
mgnify:CR=1 FL=1